MHVPNGLISSVGAFGRGEELELESSLDLLAPKTAVVCT